MKYTILKKRLLVEFVVVAIVLAVLGGIAYLLDTMHQEHTAQKSTLEGEVSAVSNETNGLREKYIRRQKDQDLYQLVMNLSNSDMLSHNTGIVDVRLKEYEDKYNMDGWTFDNNKSAINLDPSLYQRKTNVIVLREAALVNLQALNDQDFFNIMRDMQKDFPGAVSFTSFKMNRESNVTDEALRTITQYGLFPLLKGEIRLFWYAIEPTDPEELKRQNEANKQRPRRRR
jgi:hypothetical protein